jgi:hypothetical protein
MSCYEKLRVEPIPPKDAYPMLLNVHYARRVPSISYAWGLFTPEGLLEGVVTYGTPSSAPLRRGLCGDEWKNNVLELNRLCLLHNPKNAASFLVATSLKQLPRPRIVVSFADISQGHTGYVYQATNFFYCGLSAKRTDWKIKGREHLHGQTVADEFRGRAHRADLMREKYGDDFYLAPRARKHRYVYFTGDRGEKKTLGRALKYPVLPYPKQGVPHA